LADFVAMDLEFTLSFTGNQWICYNNEKHFSVDSLEELDRSIQNYLQQNYHSGTYNVKMFFDFDRFPHWHRQYMPHYFNRDLEFKVE